MVWWANGASSSDKVVRENFSDDGGLCQKVIRSVAWNSPGAHSRHPHSKLLWRSNVGYCVDFIFQTSFRLHTAYLLRTVHLWENDDQIRMFNLYILQHLITLHLSSLWVKVPVVPSVGTLEVIWNFHLTLRVEMLMRTFEVLCWSPDSNFIESYSLRTSHWQTCAFSGNPQGCFHTRTYSFSRPRHTQVSAKEWTNVGFVYILVMIQYWCMSPFFDLTSITMVFYGLIIRVVFFWRKFIWSIFRKSDIVCTILEIQRTL